MIETRPRFISFTQGTLSRWGRIEGDSVHDLSGHYPSLRNAIEVDALSLLATANGPEIPLDSVQLTIPVPNPEKIICVGVNYPDRNEEYKDNQAAATYPSLFIRFPSSFVAAGQPLMRPLESPQLDYEGEVVIIIGKGGRRIPRTEAYRHIAAISIANEGTIRDWVRHAKFNVTQGKNFDGSGSIGPWLVPFSEESQLADIEIRTNVNGQERQRDRTRRMIFDMPYLIAYISSFTTLVPGDVILTGTPTGAGARFDPAIWLKPGDVVDIYVEGIGTLSNPVADEVTP
jgi:2-keto-4-pentenoate hydratase/2-oxohepta-3-ene-1,7-dioic acid hydratase in catechol pathway